MDNVAAQYSNAPIAGDVIPSASSSGQAQRGASNNYQDVVVQDNAKVHLGNINGPVTVRGNLNIVNPRQSRIRWQNSKPKPSGVGSPRWRRISSIRGAEIQKALDDKREACEEEDDSTSDNPPRERTFTPYYRNGLSHTTARLVIENVLRMPLKFQERHGGYVYIYESPSADGYVKIGVSQDAKDRLGCWKRQCKHDVSEYPQHACREPVENAYRVERLVHAELEEWRVKELRCSGCGKTHVEWFGVSPEYAARAIAKYVKWTGEGLYKPESKIYPGSKSQEWILDTENFSDSKIKSICKPLADDSKEQRSWLGYVTRFLP